MVHSLSTSGESVAVEPPLLAFSTFPQFVMAHQTAVFTFCFRMLGNDRLAEWSAAKAFRDVYPRFPNITLIHVLTAACHRCRQRLCHPYPGQTAVDDIQPFFDQLPIPEREVMTLCYACKLNFSEIAAVLNISSAAARVTLRQGRWQVANSIGQF